MNCDISEATKIAKSRNDYSGQTIVISYESWKPVLVVKENENGGVDIDGILPRAVNAILTMYNLTPEYRRVSDPAGGLLPNGTWTGDLGDIQRGVVDLSIWGWAPTVDRFKVVDFTPVVVPFYFGVMVRRPRSNDISVRNYIGQFRPKSWLLLLIVNLVVWFIFFVVVVADQRKTSSLRGSLVLTITVMLRTLLNKA